MRIGTMLKDVISALFKKPITQKYPFEKIEPTERLRGRLVWDPNTCTGCGICAKDCPASALEWIVNDKQNKKFVLRYTMDNCTFCSQCVISCRTGSMSMSDEDWELAALNKDQFEIYFGKEEYVKEFLERKNLAESDIQPAAEVNASSEASASPESSA